MPGPTTFDKKVYDAMRRTDYLPDDFKTWLPRYLRYLSSLQIGKAQIPGIMGEIFKNVGDSGNPAFPTGWRHYSAGASAYGKVRYYKDYTGIVHLEGVAETTATPGSPLVYSLPAGYRPVQQQLIGCIANAPSGTQVLCRVEILVTGDIQVQNPAYTVFTSGSWLSLCDIHFRAG